MMSQLDIVLNSVESRWFALVWVILIFAAYDVDGVVFELGRREKCVSMMGSDLIIPTSSASHGINWL